MERQPLLTIGQGGFVVAVRVVTDSANYLPAEDLERLGILRVPLYVHDGDQMRPETEIDLDAFYRRLADIRTLPTSSQPSPDEIVRAFTQAAEGGNDVLGAFISAKMSGACQAAELAADMVREQGIGADIAVLDTESNSMQEGFAVLSAAEVAAADGAIADCISAARATISRTRYLFTPHTLEYLVRGGRISGASALLGGLLKITPVLTVENGVTDVAAKVRTRARALVEIATRMRHDIERHGFKRAVIHAIVDVDEAARFGRELIEPLVGQPVPVIPLGPVIGLHVGPAVAVVYETVDPLR